MRPTTTRCACSSGSRCERAGGCCRLGALQVSDSGVNRACHLTFPALGAVLLLAVISPTIASPWAEVGDSALRSDIEILVAAGVLDNVASHWPLPWTAIAHKIETASLGGQSARVQAAADRLLVRAHRETADGWQGTSDVLLTNQPNPVYDFGGLARGDGETRTAIT